MNVGAPGEPDAAALRRAWTVIAGLFAMLAVSAGFGFYGLSVYISALNSARGFSVSDMSGATAVFFIASGVSGFGVAYLLRRFDVRVVVVGGTVLAAAMLVLLGRVATLWQVYVVYALFGVGYAATGLVVSTTVVARWFDRKRAIALSVASTGLSVGGILFTPLARSWLRSLDLSTATTRLGLVYALVVIPLALLCVRSSPESYGLTHDGRRLSADEAAIALADRPQPSGIPFSQARRSPVFWVITTVFMLALGAQVGAIAQLIKLAEERITDANAAGRTVSILAACSVTGRLVGGALMPRLGERRFTLLALWGQSASITALAFTRGIAPIYLAAITFGLAVGNVLLLHPLILATTFGVAEYPRIYGLSQFVTTFGVAGGPFLYGWLRDHAGGYRTSYLVGGALAMIAASTFTIYDSGPRRFSQRQARLTPRIR